ncbi:MAG: winged helix-turn-helix transcriptional regulator [Patescibacteria group bacterium]|nr:winged helix-turn-helix transcriptional regulator [Patescibacteria group bacterium]
MAVILLPSNDDNPTKILRYLEANPGTHLRKINTDLEIALGTLRYHLEFLEKTGRIISEKHDLFRYYFTTGALDEIERNTIKMLHQETSRQIVMFILEKKTPSQKDIVKNIMVSTASARWHLRRLVELGIILESREGKYRRYQFVINSDIVVKLLKIHYPNEWNRWSNKIVNLFLLSKEN